MRAAEPSPEVKAILADYCRRQREKYGENWKEIKAAQMGLLTWSPILDRLFGILMPAATKK